MMQKITFIWKLCLCFSFKVWRLTGELIYEYKTGENQELWQVLWQPGTYPRGQRPPMITEDGSTPGKRKNTQLKSLKIEYSFITYILTAKAAGAYRAPHLRQTTRQVPKLHEDVPVKPATQQKQPRVPRPGGVEELFTGDLEKDKKIKNVHKVCLIFVL